jgi:hypothetical protein
MAKQFPEFYEIRRFITTFKTPYPSVLSQINPLHAIPSHFSKVKVKKKRKFTQEQATKAQRGSTDIALPFL